MLEPAWARIVPLSAVAFGINNHIGHGDQALDYESVAEHLPRYYIK